MENVVTTREGENDRMSFSGNIEAWMPSVSDPRKQPHTSPFSLEPCTDGTVSGREPGMRECAEPKPASRGANPGVRSETRGCGAKAGPARSGTLGRGAPPWDGTRVPPKIQAKRGIDIELTEENGYNQPVLYLERE